MRQLRWGGILALVLSGTTGLLAQKSKPQPVTLEASATFECPGVSVECATPAVSPPDPTGGLDDAVDRVRGDGQGSYDYYNVLAGTGAFIGSTGMFSLRVSPLTPVPASGHYVQLHFGTPTELRNGGLLLPCDVANNCNPTGRPAGLMMLEDVELRAKPVTSTGADLANGIFALPCSDAGGNRVPWDAIVHFTFPDAKGNGHWGLNFNPTSPAEGSTFAKIERTSRRTWIIRATIAQRAGLIGFSHSGIQGKKGPSREGTYILPFELNVTTKYPDANVPNGAGCAG
jgi:hypothetical protein